MSRAWLRTGALLFGALSLSACAGLPIGHHNYILVGIGFVHVAQAAKATAVSSYLFGLMVGCGQLTVGVSASYCASIPIDGNVAIIERASGPDQKLTITPLATEKPQ